jgi:hypothetical protein
MVQLIREAGKMIVERFNAEGWTLGEATKRVQDVRASLAKGRLVMWGRIGTPDAASTIIPASAWPDTFCREDVGDPLVIAGEPIFGLRVFPVLHSPKAAEQLNGLSLAEAFDRYVIGDGEVIAMSDEMLKISTSCWLTFRDGRFPGSERDLHWPLHSTMTGIILGFMWSLPKSRRSDPSDVITAISRALAERFAALIDLLVRGEIVAFGTYVKTGEERPIGQGQWVRRDFWLNVCNGDLCEKQHVQYVAIWTGIVLRARWDVSQGVVTASPSVAKSNVELAKTSQQPTARAESKCAVWLKGIIAASPEIRTRTNESLLEEARSKWPGGQLSKRGFERALGKAIESELADAWGRGGRPKKTSAA